MEGEVSAPSDSVEYSVKQKAYHQPVAGMAAMHVHGDVAVAKGTPHAYMDKDAMHNVSDRCAEMGMVVIVDSRTPSPADRSSAVSAPALALLPLPPRTRQSRTCTTRTLLRRSTSTTRRRVA